MPEESIETAIHQIRALCRQLAERRGLTPETRDELCGHMEDKLSGYLKGEIPLSVDDALVLVRAHFGDADQVCQELSHQHSTGRESFFSLQFNHQRVYLTLLVFVAFSTTLTIPLGLCIYTLRQVGVVSGRSPFHVPNWALPWFIAISAGYIAFILVTLTARRLNPAAGRRLTRALNFTLLLAPPVGTLLGLYGLLKIDRHPKIMA